MDTMGRVKVVVEKTEPDEHVRLEGGGDLPDKSHEAHEAAIEAARLAKEAAEAAEREREIQRRHRWIGVAIGVGMLMIAAVGVWPAFSRCVTGCFFTGIA